MKQLMQDRIEPGLFTLPRVDLNQAVAVMLSVDVSRFSRATLRTALTPQLSLDERRGVEAL
jgi:hypothetical protein